MKPWKIPDNNDNPDLTPMIDIVFLLIVFFMTVANIITSSKVEIEVPIAHDSVIPENPGMRDIISVLPNGDIFLGARLATLTEVKAALSENKRLSNDYKVFVRSDAGTPFKHTRDVMNACAEVGVLNVIFATYQDEK